MAAFGDVHSHPETTRKRGSPNVIQTKLRQLRETAIWLGEAAEMPIWVTRLLRHLFYKRVSIPMLLRCAWAANQIEQKTTSSQRTNCDANPGEVYSNYCRFHKPFWANLQKTYWHIFRFLKFFKKNSIHTPERTTTPTKWEPRYFLPPILRLRRRLRSVTNHVLWVPRQPHSAMSKDTVWFMNGGEISFRVMRGEGTKWRLDYAVKLAAVPKACSWEEQCERVLI